MFQLAALLMTTNHTTFNIHRQKKNFPNPPFVYYEGNFDLEAIDRLVEEVDQRVDATIVGKRMKKKVLNISIEILQNTFRYLKYTNLPKNNNEGFFAVYKHDGGINIDSGNFLKKSDVKNVSSRISIINEQLFDELTVTYRKGLDEGDISDQGGAGLGFIDIARKSGNKINHEFTKIDEDYSFFVLKINING